MIDKARPLLLGSASPRRREILETLGLPVRVVAAPVDESASLGEAASDYLVRITIAKLEAVARRPEVAESGAILVADTAVVLDGHLIGKPSSEGEARTMIRALSGRTHRVMTRFALSSPAAPHEALHAETVTTEVVFRDLEDAEVTAYARTGEGLDKAGAYGIQGIGGFAVRRIDGSYSNVVGLPACELILALRSTGLLDRFPLPRGDKPPVVKDAS